MYGRKAVSYWVLSTIDTIFISIFACSTLLGINTLPFQAWKFKNKEKFFLVKYVLCKYEHLTIKKTFLTINKVTYIHAQYFSYWKFLFLLIHWLFNSLQPELWHHILPKLLLLRAPLLSPNPIFIILCSCYWNYQKYLIKRIIISSYGKTIIMT